MIIGLTGNTGSGKTLTSQYLSQKGALVLDCDKINHHILLNNENAKKEITDFFGTVILDENNNINRKILGSIVFSSDEKLKVLTEITHRYVVEEVKRKIQENEGKFNLIVIDAPLLIEAGLHHICDKVWVVESDKEIKIKRIMQRDSLTYGEAFKRLSKQMDIEELEKYAHVLIKNDGSEEALLLKVEAVLAHLQNKPQVPVQVLKIF